MSSVFRIKEGFSTYTETEKRLAEHILEHKDDVINFSAQVLGEKVNTSAAAVVRFAKHFGFSGFSEMQALFREGLTRQLAPGRNYRARIRDIIESGSGSLSSVEIAREFLAGSIVERLAQQPVAADRIDRDQLRVAARDQQRDERRLRRIVLHQRRQQMAFHVVHADRRHVQRPGQ